MVKVLTSYCFSFQWPDPTTQLSMYVSETIVQSPPKQGTATLLPQKSIKKTKKKNNEQRLQPAGQSKFKVLQL